MTRITQQQFDNYVKHGFVIIPNFLKPAELASARTNFAEYFPTAEEFEQHPLRYSEINDDPEHLQIEFPFAGDALNHISTHPAILEFVRKVLGVDRITLTQSAIWAKYANTGDFEQGLHLDYQGNTLVVPRDDGAYRQVNMILYYSDVDETLAPTMVVSQEKTKDIPLWPTHKPKKKNAALYDLERPVLAQAGDLLIFSMRTWHRASGMTAESGARFTHHLVYRAQQHAFQGYHLYSKMGENPDLQRFVEFTTPEQRQAIGFPPPGDPYWTKETLEAVQLRYPKMDMTPYRLL